MIPSIFLSQQNISIEAQDDDKLEASVILKPMFCGINSRSCVSLIEEVPKLDTNHNGLQIPTELMPPFNGLINAPRQWKLNHCDLMHQKKSCLRMKLYFTHNRSYCIEQLWVRKTITIPYDFPIERYCWKNNKFTLTISIAPLFCIVRFSLHANNSRCFWF